MKSKYLIFVPLSVFWIILDQITKWQMIERFRLGESLPIIPGWFNLTYVRNPGVAFGFLGTLDPSIRQPLLTLLPLGAMAVIGYVVRTVPDTQRKLIVALSLITGGAIGNLLDRIRLGYVVDSLDFHWQGQYHFPAFNAADIGICVGVGILMLDLVCPAQTSQSQRSERLG